MRFREVEHIIDMNYDNLIFKIESTSNGKTKVKDYFKLVTAINNIEPLGFIDKEIKALKEIYSPLNAQSSTNEMIMENGTYNVFVKNVQTIIDKCAAIRSIINTCLPKQDPLSVTIGLPEMYNFSDLAEFNKKLEKILTLFLEDDADKVRVQNFDSGSLWTEIAFSSLVVMGSFGSLISLVSYLFVTIRKHKIAELQLDELEYDQKIKNELKTALHKKALKELELDVKEYLGNDSEPTPEKISSTTKAAMLLFDLPDEGTTFEAAISTNKEIQGTYPSIETYKNLPTNAKHKISGEIPKMINQISEDTDG